MQTAISTNFSRYPSMSNSCFKFKKFEIHQDRCAMKVGTDGVLLGAWAEGGKRILDIGCGTGLISLMMAQRFPLSHITGIDIDSDACLQASENITASPLASQIEIVCSPVQDFNAPRFDSIVSNPPFFVNSLASPDAKRNLARHSSSLPFSDLFAGVDRLLAENGVFSAIIPIEAEEEFSSEAFLRRLRPHRRILVKTTSRKRPKRVLMSFSRGSVPPVNGEVFGATSTLLQLDGKPTDWYQELTADFYVSL